ncbi:hypothetical protein A616_16520 [Brevibacillus brevis X23]|nr:hypothetical protein A616_16520 [Brevibacillus brevis X23]
MVDLKNDLDRLIKQLKLSNKQPKLIRVSPEFNRQLRENFNIEDRKILVIKKSSVTHISEGGSCSQYTMSDIPIIIDKAVDYLEIEYV